MPVKAIIFDAYGTLYDVNSVMDKCEQFFPGKGKQISDSWRQKQLEYSWLRSLMGRYENFWSVTRDALVFAIKELKLNANAEMQLSLLNQYLQLKPFPEVPNALQQLKNLIILSNGTTDMLNTLVINSGLSQFFAQIISADELKIYKPFMGVYQLAAAKLGINKEETLFVTSNSWDASGAKTFGFQVCWINRNNKPFDILGVKPNMIMKDLNELVENIHQ